MFSIKKQKQRVVALRLVLRSSCVITNAPSCDSIDLFWLSRSSAFSHIFWSLHRCAWFDAYWWDAADRLAVLPVSKRKTGKAAVGFLQFAALPFTHSHFNYTFGTRKSWQCVSFFSISLAQWQWDNIVCAFVSLTARFICMCVQVRCTEAQSAHAKHRSPVSGKWGTRKYVCCISKRIASV